jgi:hypothetical protein
MSYLSILGVQYTNHFAISKLLTKKDAQEHSKLENLTRGKFNSILLHSKKCIPKDKLWKE